MAIAEKFVRELLTLFVLYELALVFFCSPNINGEACDSFPIKIESNEIIKWTVVKWVLMG